VEDLAVWVAKVRVFGEDGGVMAGFQMEVTAGGGVVWTAWAVRIMLSIIVEGVTLDGRLAGGGTGVGGEEESQENSCSDADGEVGMGDVGGSGWNREGTLFMVATVILWIAALKPVTDRMARIFFFTSKDWYWIWKKLSGVSPLPSRVSPISVAMAAAARKAMMRRKEVKSLFSEK
jgi:hypothetical protein